ncbi:MAG: ACP S-malonyltransferase [Steroidobacteraceae bacterium]
MSGADARIALVFPGQGSQSRGMLAALAARYALVQKCFAQASAALDFDLWRLVAEGPEERLNATEFTQPAMLAAGVATWRVWLSQGGARPAVVSGHSLGEFTALVCAEALAFEPAVILVHERGRLMQQAVPDGEGAMAAILGLDDRAVEGACAEAQQQLAAMPPHAQYCGAKAASAQVVEAVNYNSPGQVVIAGHSAAVELALQIARTKGAKRALRLPISVPAHSSLMRAAAGQLQQRLGQLHMSAPRYGYISAVDACAHSDPEDIRATLVRQLAAPVRWAQTVHALRQSATTLIECGPGKVLTGLNRRIERGASCYALEDPDGLAAALKATSTTAGELHA